MDSFDKRIWSPVGSRPHIEIPAAPAVAELAAAYTAQAAAWWAEHDDPRDFHAIVRPVAPEFLHLTVGWLDQLTATLAPGAFDALHAVLTDRLADLEPFEVTVGPGIVGAVALELYVAPILQAAALAATVRGAIRDVFGADAAPEPPPARPWRPHITAFYGAASFSTDALASRVLCTLAPGEGCLITPVTMAVDAVLLVDQDTWGSDGLAWNQDTARRIALGAR